MKKIFRMSVFLALILTMPYMSGAAAGFSISLLCQKQQTAQRNNEFIEAVMRGKDKLMLGTLESKADINCRSALNERTALILAAGNSCFPIVNILVSNKADINAVDDKGVSALMYACAGSKAASKKESNRIVRLLLINKADSSLESKKESTALSLAQYYKNQGALDLLEEFSTKKS